MTLSMNNSERVSALQTFGYDAGEASFLCVVALHSGYFVRREFLSFIKGNKGWKDIILLNKLKARRHCRVNIFRHNRMVYHLCAKPFYDAIGERDNRNRRERQPSTIKNKLMGLDFVLEHPQHTYLATEREKLDYFVSTLRIPEATLPTRWYQSPRERGATAKHFVDKYPLFLSVPHNGTTPVVHFCYVDEGMQTTDGFATHLSQYSRLFAALPDFRVIYIAQHDGLLRSARRVFDAFVAQDSPHTGAPLDPVIRQMLNHFEVRRQYEARDFSCFDTARLISYRDERKRFSDERSEALYRKWQAEGASAVLGIVCRGGDVNVAPERFSTHVLEYDYDLFGTLTSEPKAAPQEVE